MAGVIDHSDRQTEPEHERALPRQRGRRRWPWVAGVAAIVAVALIAGGVWVGTNVVYYQPLQPSGLVVPMSDSSVQVSLAGGDPVEIVSVRPGEEFVVWAQLRNSGDRPVQIDQVMPVSAGSLFVHVGAERGLSSGQRRQFEPFVLEPGEWAAVGNRYRFHECVPVDEEALPLAERPLGDLQLGGKTSWQHQEIRFSVGGYGRSTAMALSPRPVIWWDEPNNEGWDPNQCPGVDSAGGTEP